MRGRIGLRGGSCGARIYRGSPGFTRHYTRNGRSKLRSSTHLISPSSSKGDGYDTRSGNLRDKSEDQNQTQQCLNVILQRVIRHLCMSGLRSTF